MNHQDHENKKEHNHGKWMILCLVAMAVLILFPRLGVELGSFGRFAPFAIFLICPLMHIGMFFMMRDKQGSCHGSQSTDEK